MNTDIFAVNQGLQEVRLLPPDKRYPNIIALGNIFFSQLQYLRDLWLGSWRTGFVGLPYLPTTTYQLGNRVIYKSKVYQSLIAGNNALPTDINSWSLLLDNFVGVDERIQYNGTTIVLEYAINKHFATVFRQPPNRSDIYTVTNTKAPSGFIIGGTESISSIVYLNASSEVIVNSYASSVFYNLTIMVPIALFNSLDPSAANATQIITNFAKGLVVAGITFNIQTY